MSDPLESGLIVVAVLAAICVLGDFIFGAHARASRSIPSFGFTVRLGDGTAVEGERMSVSLRSDQKVTLHVRPKDHLGKPAALDGVPAWAVDDPTVVTLSPAADGASCDVVPTGVVGTVNVTVSGDADLGQGVRTVVGTITVSVSSSEAAQIDVDADAPVDQ